MAEYCAEMNAQAEERRAEKDAERAAQRQAHEDAKAQRLAEIRERNPNLNQLRAILTDNCHLHVADAVIDQHRRGEWLPVTVIVTRKRDNVLDIWSDHRQDDWNFVSFHDERHNDEVIKRMQSGSWTFDQGTPLTEMIVQYLATF